VLIVRKLEGSLKSGLAGGGNGGGDEPDISLVPPAVPEPSTLATKLIGFGGLGYAGYRRVREPRSA
jgi:hypothetical protein